MDTVTEIELETRISDTAVMITALAKSNQKKPLRKALAELACLKANRSMFVIHQLDLEKGLDSL